MKKEEEEVRQQSMTHSELPENSADNEQATPGNEQATPDNSVSLLLFTNTQQLYY